MIGQFLIDYPTSAAMKEINVETNINQQEAVIDLQQEPSSIYFFEINCNNKVF